MYILYWAESIPAKKQCKLKFIWYKDERLIFLNIWIINPLEQTYEMIDYLEH